MPPHQDALGGTHPPTTAAQRRSLIFEATNFPKPQVHNLLGVLFCGRNLPS
jgi:hypothetical protein